MRPGSNDLLFLHIHIRIQIRRSSSSSLLQLHLRLKLPSPAASPPPPPNLILPFDKVFLRPPAAAPAGQGQGQQSSRREETDFVFTDDEWRRFAESVWRAHI